MCQVRITFERHRKGISSSSHWRYTKFLRRIDCRQYRQSNRSQKWESSLTQGDSNNQTNYRTVVLARYDCRLYCRDAVHVRRSCRSDQDGTGWSGACGRNGEVYLHRDCRNGDTVRSTSHCLLHLANVVAFNKLPLPLEDVTLKHFIKI